MHSPPSILLYGREPGLLQSRRWIFEAAGFDAASAASLGEVRGLAGGRHWDILLLCHSLSSADCRDALTWAGAFPRLKRLVLSTGAPQCPELRSACSSDEEVLGQFAGARELVAAARRLLAEPPLSTLAS